MAVMGRDVYFETITPAHRTVIARYLRRGDRVFVYDFTYRLRTIDWLVPLIDDGRIERIYVHPLSVADHRAIRATEWLYPRVAGHGLARRLARVFGEDEAETVLKKALLETVFPYWFMRVDLERRRDHPGRMILIPDTYRSTERALRDWSERPEPLTNIDIPFVAAARFAVEGRWRRWAGAARLIGSTLLRARRARRAAHGRSPAGPRAFDHVYAIEQPFQTKFEGERRFDFLVDGDLLTRKNTAFLVSEGADGEWAERARGEGFEILWRRDYVGQPAVLDVQVPRRAPVASLIASTAVSISTPGWLRDAAATAASVLVSDTPFLERVSVRNYIYTNQDTVLQGWRNALLRRYGVRSWCFTLAIGGGYLYSDGPEAEHRFWAHQNEDFFVTASRQLVDYHRRHPQRVGRHLDVGNLWSELTLQTERKVGRDPLRAQWFGERARHGKVIAWFDTTFIEADGSPSTYTEALAWYADLLRLLEEDEHLLAVVKPSKDEKYFVDPRSQWANARLGPRVLDLWDQLRQHPRVYFPGHVGDPTTIVAASDLTVTYCFSSITAEALGARRRAFWYEPGERWRGVPYDRVAGLVVHGFGELTQRVRALLHETDDTAWDRYLEGSVKGLVEDHLDGRGLSRFRAALSDREGAQ